MLTPIHIIFYLFAVIAVGSATMVVTTRNPVRSVLSLVVTFFGMAGIWMILRAEFLSLILVLVYVGAVMTLFLFIVMMLNIDKEDTRSGFVRYFPVGLVVMVLLMVLIITALGPDYFGLGGHPVPAPEAADYSNIAQLGSMLYTDYAYPFEIAGVLLLAAIIAAITLAHRRPHKRKMQNIGEQVAAKPEDYVRLVNMKSATAEKKEDGN